jgi:flavin prenyltransferase
MNAESKKQRSKNRSLPVAVALTGASGAIYGVRLLQCLGSEGVEVHAVVSDAARLVLKEELDLSVKDLSAIPGVVIHGNGEVGACIASGSFLLRGTVICPCSASSLGMIAQGVGATLIARMGAVALKERWPIVLVPRESPYSTPFLENMKLLSLYGATILPASPSFYRQPKTIEELVDSVIDRVMVKLGFEALLPDWQGLKASK